MSQFEQQLKEEMEKRGLNEPPPSSHRNTKKTSFSFGSFLKGIVLGLFLLAGLAGWAHYKSPETNEIITARLPSKTAVIAFEDMPAIRTSDIQPVLKMGTALPTPSIEETVTTIEVDPVKIELPKTPTTAPEEQPPTQVAEVNQEEEAITETIEPITALSKNTKGMVPAPVPGLYENSPIGAIPKIREQDGLTAFKAYKHAFIKEPNKPKLSIIITDLGLSKKVTMGAIENFPDTITLAFSPYTANLKNTIKMAREDGHEAWLMLPLETENFPLNDPGPLTLLSNARVEKNADRLRQILASAEGYVGFIPPSNHIFKTEDANINPSIHEMFERGLAVYDSKTESQSFLTRIAEKEGYPYAQNNFWLDENLTPLSINQSLRRTMEYAEATGSATLMLRPYPASIKALQKFLNSAAADKFQLAPASAMVSYDG